MNQEYRLVPIGIVAQKTEQRAKLEIYEAYRAGLKDLDQFSHALILWWISENNTDVARQVLQSTPPFERAPQTGVFSSRSPRRPNPIGLTVVALLDVDMEKGEVSVDHMDAFEQTPLLDIKPYIPSSEHIPLEKVRLPFWFEELLQPRDIL